MNESTYVIALPPDATRQLAENGVDLVTALRHAGLSVQRAPAPQGMAVPEGTKEVVLVIVGIGVTAALVAGGVTKILDAVGRNKKYLVTTQRLVPVLDGAGKPVLDKKGRPVMYWTDEAQLIEAKQTTQGLSESSVEVSPTMIKFTSKSGK